MGLDRNGKKKMGLEEETIEFPKQIKELKNIQKVSCGYWHSLALDTQG